MLDRRFDPLFAKYSGVVKAKYGVTLPVPFLRALGKRESNLNPSEADMPAFGLLQVIPKVAQSHNKRHGTSFSHGDMLNPDANVRVATDLLARIVVAYGKHPGRNLQENWGNPEFVKLVTAGWNSGYSEAGGVGRVADYLEAHHIPVTHDSVFASAGAAGATRHLQNDKKRRWQRTVAELFFQQPDRGASAGIIVLAVGVAAFFLLKRLVRS